MRPFLLLVPVLILPAAESTGFFIDTRLRVEQRDTGINGTEAATAVTWRIAPGWQTPTWQGLRAVVQVQAVVALVDDYSLPTKANGNFDVIEDPKVLDLGNAYGAWGSDGFEVRLGREALSLDDHRWISAQPWRQKQQTLDGAHLAYAGHGITAD